MPASPPASSRPVWSYLPVVAILVFGLALSVYAFRLARQAELDELHERFMQLATERIYEFELALQTDLETIKFVGDFYNASLFVERREFRTFVQRLMEERPDIHYLGWAPRVREEQRLAIVTLARSQGYQDFEITEHTPEGRRPAPVRAEYFPLVYVAPEDRNDERLGDDLGAEPVFREALERARDEARLVASQGFALERGESAVTGFLAFWPIYAKWQPTPTVEQRRRHLQGFAVIGLRLAGIVARTRSPDLAFDLPVRLHVYDLAAPLPRQTLYGAPPAEPPAQLLRYTGKAVPERFRLARRLEIGGRTWLLLCDTDPAALNPFHDRTPWAILTLGLLLTLTLVSYLLSSLSRSATIHREVEERTRALAASNAELGSALERLQETQEHLVQAEKMASLGSLVAGVAHEINTPVGVSVTAASTLRNQAGELRAALEQGQLKRSSLSRFIDTAEQSTRIILGNLERAAELIRSFKEVAVDQSSSDRRRFAVKPYLDEILLSLRPQLKRTPHRVELICADAALCIDGYPGALSQILTNLIMNSLTHAYDDGQAGLITIEVRAQNAQLVLRYADDGKGIPKEQLGRIFEPFFTTRRGSGGSGLGLHVVYNLVSQKLGGRIRVTSEPGKGTEFLITIPTE